MHTPRRRFLAAGALAASMLALPALASSRRILVPMTDGPFYPARASRERWSDWDADLTRVERNGQMLVARGEHLGLEAVVADTKGRLIDSAEVEIWQCDAMAVYRHPRQPTEPGRFDEGFQGFGATRSNGQGALRLRTIKPVPYPGRTPHIHVKLRHASFGELTSQFSSPATPAMGVTSCGGRWTRPIGRHSKWHCSRPRPTVVCAGWHGTRWWCRPEKSVKEADRPDSVRPGLLRGPGRDRHSSGGNREHGRRRHWRYVDVQRGWPCLCAKGHPAPQERRQGPKTGTVLLWRRYGWNATRLSEHHANPARNDATQPQQSSSPLMQGIQTGRLLGRGISNVAGRVQGMQAGAGMNAEQTAAASDAYKAAAQAATDPAQKKAYEKAATDITRGNKWFGSSESAPISEATQAAGADAATTAAAGNAAEAAGAAGLTSAETAAGASAANAAATGAAEGAMDAVAGEAAGATAAGALGGAGAAIGTALPWVGAALAAGKLLGAFARGGDVKAQDFRAKGGDVSGPGGPT